MKRTLGITILLLVGAMAVQSQGRPSGAFQYSGSSWVAAAASSITGTAVTATSTTQTKGNATVQAQTLTFAAGDQIGIYISTAGATCTTDSFVVTAQYSTP